LLACAWVTEFGEIAVMFGTVPEGVAVKFNCTPGETFAC
jgi:hypothetical protein